MYNGALGLIRTEIFWPVLKVTAGAYWRAFTECGASALFWLMGFVDFRPLFKKEKSMYFFWNVSGGAPQGQKKKNDTAVKRTHHDNLSGSILQLHCSRTIGKWLLRTSKPSWDGVNLVTWSYTSELLFSVCFHLGWWLLNFSLTVRYTPMS